MKIKIENKVKEYLKKKNKNALKIDVSKGGCWVKIPVPYVTMESVDNEKEYIRLEEDGIDIFIKKGITAKKDTITIKLSGFIFFKNLEVYGVDISF